MRGPRSLTVLLCLVLTGLWAVSGSGGLGTASAAAEMGAKGPAGKQADYVPGRYIVVLKDSVRNVPAVSSQLAQQHGATPIHVYQHALRGFSAKMSAQAAEALHRNPQVEYVEQVIKLYAVAQEQPTGVRRIRTHQATSYPPLDGIPDAPDVDVAVIDTGVANHLDLNVVGGASFVPGDPSYADGHGHGTHVAGIVGALDNDFGVVGVCPGARIWSVRVLGSDGSGMMDDIIAGVEWVTALKTPGGENIIDVANMSLGGWGWSPSLQTAIRSSVNAGVIYMAAAGNDADDILWLWPIYAFIPAAYPEVAAISALADSDGQPGGLGAATKYGPDDSFAAFSNYSTTVLPENPIVSPGGAIDLVLPGVAINSTCAAGLDTGGDGYEVLNGTSMASPHAAGLAARHVAQHGRAVGAAGVYAIRQFLVHHGVAQDSADGLYVLNDPDNLPENLGWALWDSQPSDYPPSVTITSPVNSPTVSGDVLITAEASDDHGVVEVRFSVDDTTIGSDTVGMDGWSWTWDSTGVPDGPHTIIATAVDTIGQTASDWSDANVDNVDDMPSVAITTPANNATVSGPVAIAANASDDHGVVEVSFFIDDTNNTIGTDTNGADGWSASWDSNSVADGLRTIIAIAYDTIGQTASDSVNVTVQNAPGPSVGPTVQWINPSGGVTVDGTVKIQLLAEDDEDPPNKLTVQWRANGGPWESASYKRRTGYHEASWDTTQLEDGPCTLTAIATDTGGNAGGVVAIEVTVSNGSGGGETGTGTIYGDVIDGNLFSPTFGQPVVGASVEVDGYPNLSAVTNSRGKYSISGVPGGTAGNPVYQSVTARAPNGDTGHTTQIGVYQNKRTYAPIVVGLE